MRRRARNAVGRVGVVADHQHTHDAVNPIHGAGARGTSNRNPGPVMHSLRRSRAAFKDCERYGRTWLRGHDEPIRPEHHGSDARLASHFASELIRQLKRCGVPSRVADSIRLIDRFAVMESRELGRFALFPETNSISQRFLRSTIDRILEDEL